METYRHKKMINKYWIITTVGLFLILMILLAFSKRRSPKFDIPKKFPMKINLKEEGIAEIDKDGSITLYYKGDDSGITIESKELNDFEIILAMAKEIRGRKG